MKDAMTDHKAHVRCLQDFAAAYDADSGNGRALRAAIAALAAAPEPFLSGDGGPVSNASEGEDGAVACPCCGAPCATQHASGDGGHWREYVYTRPAAQVAATPKHDEGRGLLPCPFCPDGGAPYLFDRHGYDRTVAVRCSSCGAATDDFKNCPDTFGGNPDAIAAWNRRALATQPAARRVTDEACVWTLDDDESETWMSACGEVWQFTTGGPEDNGVRFCHHCGKPASFAQPAEGVSG